MNRRLLLFVTVAAPALQLHLGCVPDYSPLESGGGAHSMGGHANRSSAIADGTVASSGRSGSEPITSSETERGGTHAMGSLRSGSSGGASTVGDSFALGGSVSLSSSEIAGGSVSHLSSEIAGGSSGHLGATPQGGSTSNLGSIPPVNGAIESMGNNVYRITYDFENPSELDDWIRPDEESTLPLVIVDGQLAVAVSDVSPKDVVAVAQYRWPMRVTRLSATSLTLLAREGEVPHTNFYLATIWDRQWAPQVGYGCVFMTHRFFFTPQDRVVENYESTFENERYKSYHHTIALSDAELTWETQLAYPASNGAAITFKSVQTSFYQGSDRYLYVGGYETTNRFDRIVIEGTFGS